MSKDIVYEVIRIVDGKPLFLKEHIDRLIHSLKSYDKKEFNTTIIKNKIKRIIYNEKLVNNNIRIEVTEDDRYNQKYHIFSVDSFYPEKIIYDSGVFTITVNEERINPEIKVRDDKFKIKIKNELDKKEAYEAVLVNQKGKILEGSKSNLIFLKGNTFITSKLGDVLEGITLKNVLKAIEISEYKIKRRNIYYNEIENFDSAFLTGTSIDILPIKRIDNINLDSANNKVIIDIINIYKKIRETDLGGMKWV